MTHKNFHTKPLVFTAPDAHSAGIHVGFLKKGREHARLYSDLFQAEVRAVGRFRLSGEGDINSASAVSHDDWERWREGTCPTFNSNQRDSYESARPFG